MGFTNFEQEDSIWNDYRTRAVLIGFQAFATIFLILAYVLTDSSEAIYLAFVLTLAGVIVKMIKSLSLYVAPKLSTRPAGAKDCHALPCSGGASSTGMPSGHAAGAFLMAVYACDYILRRSSLSNARKYVAVIVVITVAALISASRVIYECHTREQVVAGVVVGCLMGYLAIRMRPSLYV